MSGQRLFFAIWPDAAALERLRALAARLAEQCGGRATPAEKIHLTLEFLGSVDAQRIPALERIAAGVEAPAFGMRLDRTGSFRRARVAWVGSEGQPPGLLELHARLSAGLRGEGFTLDERAFAPHVTLVRGIRRPAARSAVEAIEWRAEEFALVRSELGKGAYTTLGRWRLD